MTKKQKNKKRIKGLFLACLILGVVLFALVMLSKSPTISQKIGETVSRGIILGMGTISSYVPFSLYEVLLYLLIITAIMLVGLFLFRLFKGEFLKSLRPILTIILVALIVSNTYFISAGFYYTKGLIAVPIYSGQVTSSQLTDAAEYFINDFNLLATSLPRDDKGNIITPSDKVMALDLQKEYDRLQDKTYNNFTPVCKTIKSSWIMSQMQVAGVFFAPFGEANINSDIPQSSKPYVMLHELAHAKGVMQEDEADIVAIYIALTSRLEYVRYSGYMNTCSRILDMLDIAYSIAETEQEREHISVLYENLYASLDTKILIEYSNKYEYWNNYTLLTDFVDAVYTNFYQKIMGQKEDTSSTIGDNTNEVPVIDPDTGVPQTDPDTGSPIVIVQRAPNLMQKMMLNIFHTFLEIK